MRILLKWILRKIGWEVVDRIDLAHNRGRWRAVVNTVMNFGISERIVLASCGTVSFSTNSLLCGIK